MKQKIQVKRYRNRKLYDRKSSSYITLGHISKWVKSGEEIQVYDDNSGEDITEVVLAQVLVNEEKKVAGLSKTKLFELFGLTSGVLSDFYKKRIASPFWSWCVHVEKKTREIKNLSVSVARLERRMSDLEQRIEKLSRQNGDNKD